MARSVEEWIGRDDDHVPPLRVRVRVFEAKGGRCHKCQRKIQTGERWTLEHVIALSNGGENRERNLDVTCDWCLPGKNAADAAIKKKGSRVRAKHYGQRKAKHPMNGGKISRLKRRIDGVVVDRETGEPIR